MEPLQHEILPGRWKQITKRITFNCQLNYLGLEPSRLFYLVRNRARIFIAKCIPLYIILIGFFATLTTCYCDRIIHRQESLSTNVYSHSSARSIPMDQSGHLPLSLSSSSSLPILVLHGSHYIPNHHSGSNRGHEECEINTDPVIELLLEKMRIHLPEEKITVQNGAITIFDARIVHFAELIRLRPSCARKLDPEGIQLLLPFEAEIRSANVAAKIKYNFYVTDLYGDYTANFSHIRLNGTLEANLEEEWMQVSQFNITSSHVLDDSIVFGYVPRWILEWIRSYFDNDNTRMYEQLAKVMLQKEADNFVYYDLIRHISQSSMLTESKEEEDNVPPLNRL